MYKTSGFTQVGINHGSDERNNQDATASGSNEKFEVIVLADGVSSCEKGGEGAKITVETIKNYFLETGKSLMDIRGETISSIIKNKLNEQAVHDGIDMDEYASTLAAILINKKQKRIMYSSVGDSLILGVRDENVYIISMPADSSYGIPTTIINDNKYFNTGIIEPREIHTIIIGKSFKNNIAKKQK